MDGHDCTSVSSRMAQFEARDHPSLGREKFGPVPPR
jgi:hypothetical protein